MGNKNKLNVSPWMQLKAIKRDDEWRLEVLGVPFGGHLDGKDADGEYFSERTNIHLTLGEERPVYYLHGQQESAPSTIGRARYSRADEKGHWFEVVLDKAKEYADRIWTAATQGVARASSGAINYLCRRNEDGEYTSWPLAELTLLDMGEGRMPANALATVNLKTAFEELDIEFPEAWQEVVESTEADAEEESQEVDGDEKILEALPYIVETVVRAKRGK